MSEALGSDEIEDVVSSVRRLVSPEARPRPVSRDLGLEKLLLTPALQVVPDRPNAELPNADLPRAEPLILTERATDLGDAASSAPIFDADAVPDAEADAMSADAGQGLFDDLLMVQPVSPSSDADVLDADMTTTPHVVEGEWEDAFWSEPEPDLAEIALEAEEAELVTGGVASSVHTGGTLNDHPDRLWPEEMPPAPKTSMAEGLGSLTDADGNPVTVLDEDALNDIVRALIREELQGVLGERITQNVRKLVRAEINRALTARSLD